MKSAAEIGKTYFDGLYCFEETSRSRIALAITSKSSAYWHAGEKIDDGWVTLVHYSTVRGVQGAVAICKEALYNEIKEAACQT